MLQNWAYLQKALLDEASQHLCVALSVLGHAAQMLLGVDQHLRHVVIAHLQRLQAHCVEEVRRLTAEQDTIL